LSIKINNVIKLISLQTIQFIIFYFRHNCEYHNSYKSTVQMSKAQQDINYAHYIIILDKPFRRKNIPEMRSMLLEYLGC